jgi:hypothetical protein
MADIKQAATWMNEGKEVTRQGKKWRFRKATSGDIILGEVPGLDYYRTAVIFTEDLLAEDWEVAE